MARRRKTSLLATTPPDRTRRSTRGKSAGRPESAEAGCSGETAGVQECAENDSQDPHGRNNHKSFGKFRCLKSGESCADVEVKVVDPCTSSESDNSQSLEILRNDRFVRSFSKVRNSDSSSLKSRSIEKFMPSCNMSAPENNITLSAVSFDTQLPDPTLNIISHSDPRRCSSSSDVFAGMSPLLKMEENSKDNGECYMENFASEVTIGEESQEGDEKMNDDEEEVYTVFEIIGEDAESQDLYCENNDISSSAVPESKTPERDTFFTPSNDSISTKDGTENIFSKKFPEDSKGFNLTLDSMSLSDNVCTTSEIMPTDDFTDNSNSNETKTINNSKDRSSTKINQGSQDTPNASELSVTPTSSISEEDNLLSKIENNSVNEKISLNYSTDSSSSSSNGVRRSNRIKTINVLKQRSKGHGLVRSVQKTSKISREPVSNSSGDSVKSSSENSTNSQIILPPQSSPIFPVPASAESDPRPVKVKSRWRRSSEMEMGSRSPITPPLSSPNANPTKLNTISENDSVNNFKSDDSSEKKLNHDQDIRDRLNQFQNILENEYHCDRAISKEARKMTCDCFLTKEEIERDELGCGEDCLNRLLMIECNSRCPVGDRCTNRRFQSHLNSALCVIKTEKKGLGIQAVNDIISGEFLMEYVGEVLNWDQFSQRAQEYSSDNNRHHYFMSLKGDAVIDATLKGNISRFINHSCDPNAETQKWTVNGDLRIGFFSKRNIKAGDEITFDYQFQRYGKEALRCFCEASNCRGWIGEEPDDSEEEDELEKEMEEEFKNEATVSENIEKNNLSKVDIKPELVKVSENLNEVENLHKKVTRKPRKPRVCQTKKSVFNDLLQDMDLEEEIENLSRCGIKNQSHTLSLCRAMVRAKHLKEQISLLKLLASADLPCRRLFLDYRGLRLLAPWCESADANARLEILTVLEKLPISNKTALKETKILASVEKWLSDSELNPIKDYSSDDSIPGTPIFINESTGLPVENLNKTIILAEKDSLDKNKKSLKIIHTESQKEKISKLSKDLIQSWTSLQEAFKIPKKERIELMKEHERQANEPQTKNERDTEVESEKDKWIERYNRHDRDKKRPIATISDIPRKSQIRLDDRILTPVPAMSKEERRKEFAARAAHQEQIRRAQSTYPVSAYIGDQTAFRGVLPIPNSHWPQPLEPVPNVVPNSYEYTANEYSQSEYMHVDYNTNEYGGYQIPYSQNVYPIPPINSSTSQSYNYNTNFGQTPYQNQSYTPTPPLPAASPFKNIPLPHNPSMPMNPQPIPSLGTQHHPIPTVIAMQTTPIVDSNQSSIPQPIPSLVPSVTPSYQYNITEEPQKGDYYSLPTQPVHNISVNQEENISRNFINVSIIENENLSDVVRWTPIKLPCRWRSMKDARGRTYYYHVKFRISQWIPPLYSPTYNSKDDYSSEEELSEEEAANEDHEIINADELSITKDKLIEGVNGFYQVKKNGIVKGQQTPAITVKKKRPGLVSERIISPRQEEDIIASKLDLKRYKETKEKLRRRKEMALAAAGCPDSLNKYKKREKPNKAIKRKEVVVPEVNEKAAKRIKEIFTANMARVMVHYLDPYRRPDCPIGRITNTADFKHLARKLTHFVLLKELKHCRTVNELECNDSVKQKAKEFVKKYMAKYGPIYQKPEEDVDC